MISKLTDEERQALHKLLSEYHEREALHDWARRCFSTGARIAITIAALVATVSTLSAFLSWFLGHLK